MVALPKKQQVDMVQSFGHFWWGLKHPSPDYIIQEKYIAEYGKWPQSGNETSSVNVILQSKTLVKNSFKNVACKPVLGPF